jgi:hypothetical protein
VVKSANRSRHRLTSVAAFSFPKTPVMARPVLLWSFSSVFPLKVHYTEFVPSAEVSTSLLLPTETPPGHFRRGKLIARIAGQTGTKVSIDRSVCAATFLWIVRISCTPN